MGIPWQSADGFLYAAEVLIPRLQERVLSCPIGRSALDYPQDRYILLLNGENDG